MSSLLLVVLALGAAAWWWRDTPALQPWLAPVQRALPAAWRTGLQVPATRPATQPGPAAARKCRGPAGVVYTDERCPQGYREEAMEGGSLTVLPAAPPAAPVAGASAAPALRRLGQQGSLPDRAERVDREVQRSQNLPP